MSGLMRPPIVKAVINVRIVPTTNPEPIATLSAGAGCPDGDHGGKCHHGMHCAVIGRGDVDL
jgi:hypothetical protein